MALSLAWLAFASFAHASQFYKWTDDRGRIHYSDKPPPDRIADKLDIEVKSHTGPPKVSKFISAAPASDAIIMYSAEWCGICRRAKAYMDSEGIEYTEYDIDKSSKGRREYTRLNGKGVPLFLIGGQRMAGFSPSRLQALLAAARSD